MKKEWLALGYDEGTWGHRELLLETLEKHLPFASLLDVGSASGPDMALMRLAHPEINLKGFDLSIENVNQAQTRGLDVEQADLYEKLPEVPDKSYDVVLSNGVMMYLERKVIDELVRIARKAVVLSERDPDGNILNYLTEELHLHPKITKVTEEVRDSWKTDGYIYEITL